MWERFLGSASDESEPEVHPWPSRPLAFGSQQFLSQDELLYHSVPGLLAGNQLQPGHPYPGAQQQQQLSNTNHRGAEAEDQRMEGGTESVFW
uniref:Zinc finger protein 589 n=1 Tax=Propithecus coquereli TaxID=379532 RepID=A0A2K6GTQ8_PROCO